MYTHFHPPLPLIPLPPLSSSKPKRQHLSSYLHLTHTHTSNPLPPSPPSSPKPQQNSGISYPSAGIDADVLRALEGLAIVTAAGAGYAFLWALLLLAAPERMSRCV
jgi:hypothetical protein